jgi:hypothetical protein
MLYNSENYGTSEPEGYLVANIVNVHQFTDEGAGNSDSPQFEMKPEQEFRSPAGLRSFRHGIQEITIIFGNETDSEEMN